MFDKEKNEKIKQLLMGKIKPLRCPMCSCNKFTLVDAYIRTELQEDYKNVKLGGPSIPSIAIICNNCGFLSNHATGILGLKLDSDSEKDK